MTKYAQELKVLLSSPKKIVVTTHKGPDGDAIGSSLGLLHLLKQLLLLDCSHLTILLKFRMAQQVPFILNYLMLTALQSPLERLQQLQQMVQL